METQPVKTILKVETEKTWILNNKRITWTVYRTVLILFQFFYLQVFTDSYLKVLTTEKLVVEKLEKQFPGEMFDSVA